MEDGLRRVAGTGGASFLDSIDWCRPWLKHLRPVAGQVLSSPDWRTALNETADSIQLRNHRGLPVRFVPQETLPAGTAYESFIDATGKVPTRENLHDFFNALIWLTFPQIKRRLNALQAAEIARSGAQGMSTRGRLRDAATIFDENAAVITTSDENWARALRERRWREALLDGRNKFGEAVQMFLFGHALMEKLVRPYKAITAHAWIVSAPSQFFSGSYESRRAWLDSVVSGQIAGGFSTQEFAVLPVLGVPGWASGQDAHYYADEMVFRPLRKTSETERM